MAVAAVISQMLKDNHHTSIFFKRKGLRVILALHICVHFRAYCMHILLLILAVCIIHNSSLQQVFVKHGIQEDLFCLPHFANNVYVSWSLVTNNLETIFTIILYFSRLIDIKQYIYR